MNLALHGKHGKEKALVIDKDDEGLFATGKWHVSNNGYAYSRRHGQVIFAHRLVTGAVHGTIVDHVNGDRLDNRRQNLRLCTHAENMRNAKLSRRNRSGYKGVNWFAPRGYWRAEIRFDAQPITIAYFRDPAEAAYVRDQVALQLHGEFARTNFDLV